MANVRIKLFVTRSCLAPPNVRRKRYDMAQAVVRVDRSVIRSLRTSSDERLDDALFLGDH